LKAPALILLLIPISLTSFAAEKGDFNHLVPIYDVEKRQVSYKGEIYKFDECWLRDKDDDGVKETTICRFRPTGNPNKLITRYTLKDMNWAWGIFGNYGNREDNINNFAIIDSTGNSGFDTRYGGNESFDLPDWVKKAVSR
jgi:hypothetical protein